MLFRVIKAGPDGLCGSDTPMTLEKALLEPANHAGWDSLSQLRSKIAEWGQQALPGDVFRTKWTVIVACGLVRSRCEQCPECGASGDTIEFLEHKDIVGTKMTQEVECTACGHEWTDEFMLVNQLTTKATSFSEG